MRAMGTTLNFSGLAWASMLALGCADAVAVAFSGCGLGLRANALRDFSTQRDFSESRGGRQLPRSGPRMMAVGKRSALRKAFKKPTGALTVSVEYERTDSSTYSENDLAVLSMQLRKAKAAAVWTASLDDLAIVGKEQQSAKGNFPGPCPGVVTDSFLSCPGPFQVCGYRFPSDLVLLSSFSHILSVSGDCHARGCPSSGGGGGGCGCAAAWGNRCRWDGRRERSRGDLGRQKVICGRREGMQCSVAT